ncbi:Nucleolar protein NOP52/RRP1 [Phaffia rhodozyma]|uniref:Nucleolar protein NOP52/RRP1 n=1 Tax=Phaffia rhodozyma TaxID=264483 RepID=A0A0F7SU92_PHARH|nr:Nucleolar protein NOP52/RRP1 [Phaffia rhodozyma]
MPKVSKAKLERMRPVEPSAAPPLGKYLASTDKSVRDKAIRKLAGFLSRNDAEDVEGGGGRLGSDLEMKKLWKGLFYCFWMSDKPLVQQALATELSDLILLIDPKGCENMGERTLAALEFVGGFWDSIVREWSGIDRLRMDKYYMLIRRFLNATFRLLQRDNWRKESIESYNAILILLTPPPPCSIPTAASSSTTTTSPSTTASTTAAISEPSLSPPPENLPMLLNPFISLALLTQQSTTYDRTLNNVLYPFVLSLDPSLSSSPSTSSASDLDLEAFEQVDEQLREQWKKTFMSALFQAAGGEGTRDSNRRKIYTFWKEMGGGEDD